MNAIYSLDSAQEHLADIFSECDVELQSNSDLLALKKHLKSHDIFSDLIAAVMQYYIGSGIGKSI